ncbi:putative NAC domain-containing protein 83 [Cocos nucifera]|nr:putative NAC domain-containing protein 83 [Cocos nucifera]
MEKPDFIKYGAMRLPPGFRFHPTDEELVIQYLRRKAFSRPLPAAVIPEIDLGKYDPWDLPGGGSEGEQYYFSLREAKYLNGRRHNRATISGYWKATGKDRPIKASRCNQLVGLKKVLVFYRGKPPHGSRTDWIMHEYCLADPETRAFSFSQRKISAHVSIPISSSCSSMIKKKIKQFWK